MLSICLSLCLRPLHQVAPIWVGAFEQRNFQIFSAKFTKYANGIPFFAGRCCVWLVSFPILFRSNKNKKLLWRKPSAEIWQQRKSIYAIAAFYDAAAKLAKFKCNFLYNFNQKNLYLLDISQHFRIQRCISYPWFLLAIQC